jgi:hypothetical protein
MLKVLNWHLGVDFSILRCKNASEGVITKKYSVSARISKGQGAV